MPGDLCYHIVRHSLSEQYGWAEVAKLVNVQILDLGQSARSQERLSHIPSVGLLELRRVAVARCRLRGENVGAT
jgi:hypothetical protein